VGCRVFSNNNILNHYFVLKFLLVLLVWTGGCSTPPPPKPRSFSELIAVDSEKTQSIKQSFVKVANLIHRPKATTYLEQMAKKLYESSVDFTLEGVQVRIHSDRETQWMHGFSFPGTWIYLPQSFLKRVQYEN
jgi:hypothetical protein